MTRHERQQLREVTLAALGSTRLSTERKTWQGWELQTSNSFRRIGMLGDGDILCATTHPLDRQPDLSAAPGVLAYVVAAQPREVVADGVFLEQARLADVDFFQRHREGLVAGQALQFGGTHVEGLFQWLVNAGLRAGARRCRRGLR